jgi:hypothetical protein
LFLVGCPGERRSALSQEMRDSAGLNATWLIACQPRTATSMASAVPWVFPMRSYSGDALGILTRIRRISLHRATGGLGLSGLHRCHPMLQEEGEARSAEIDVAEDDTAPVPTSTPVAQEETGEAATRMLAEAVANPLFYLVGGLVAIKLVASLGEQVRKIEFGATGDDQGRLAMLRLQSRL